MAFASCYRVEVVDGGHMLLHERRRTVSPGVIGVDVVPATVVVAALRREVFAVP